MTINNIIARTYLAGSFVERIIDLREWLKNPWT